MTFSDENTEDRNDAEAGEHGSGAPHCEDVRLIICIGKKEYEHNSKEQRTYTRDLSDERFEEIGLKCKEGACSNNKQISEEQKSVGGIAHPAESRQSIKGRICNKTAGQSADPELFDDKINNWKNNNQLDHDGKIVTSLSLSAGKPVEAEGPETVGDDIHQIDFEDTKNDPLGYECNGKRNNKSKESF